jgi:hypothetical protein
LSHDVPYFLFVQKWWQTSLVGSQVTFGPRVGQ